MRITNTSYSALPEKEIFEILSHAISGSSEDHKSKRREGLEELLTRVRTDSVQNKSEAMQILLDLARIHGNSKP